MAGSTDAEFFRTIVQRSAVALIVVEPSGVVRWHTSPAARFLGGPLVDRPLQSVCDPTDAERLSVYLHGLASLTTPSTVYVQARVIHGDGSVRHLEFTGANLLQEPEVGGRVLQVSDVTQRVEVERQLTRFAMEDALTGLANRRVLTERLDHELSRLETIQTGHLGLLFIDLDRFKIVNDLFGHATGDQLLRQVAQRIASCIRPTDMAARFGGDEFGVVVGGRDETDVVTVADRILTALAEPIEVDGAPFKVSASIGVATTATARTIDALFQQADAAMYRAKAEGRGRTSIYDVDIAEWLDGRRSIVAAIEGRARQLEVENRRLTEEVRTDPLTRLPNLRRQQEDLKAAVDAHARRGVPFSVAFVDIDAFGLFNKTMGQHKGDAVLRDVGEVLQSTCRESDTVYRRGGEEFIVIFRNTAAKAAHKIAVRMKDKVKRSIDGVTVSVGLVTFDPDVHGDGEGAIAAADQLMRLAKREGGDRVVIAA